MIYLFIHPTESDFIESQFSIWIENITDEGFEIFFTDMESQWIGENIKWTALYK